VTTGYNTSRVFEAARKGKVRLNDQAWPPHPITGIEPQIALADYDPDGQAEIVWIVPDVGDDASITWRSLPNGRDEEFDLVIQITSFSMSSDPQDQEDQLLDRLEELADVVQRAFFDDAGAVAPTERVLPLDIAEAVKLEGVGQVSFQMWPNGEGLSGSAVVRYRLAFRI
jgi:hypothetical protein